MILETLLGILAIASIVYTCYLYFIGNKDFGHLFTALSAVLLTSFLTGLQSKDSLNKFSEMLPYIILILGLIAISFGIAFYISRKRFLSSIRQLGIIDAWPNRKKGFESRNLNYLSYCRSLIKKAKPGALIRLLSTAGDGVAVVKDSYIPAFRESLKNNCRFHIILMHPCSKKLLDKQDAEDKSGRYGKPRAKGAVSQKIVDKIGYLTDWKRAAEKEVEASPKAIKVRCINDVPVVNLIDNGELSLIALQVINRKGEDSPVFLVEKNGILYEYLQDHFDFLFKNYTESAEEAIKKFEKEIKPTLEEISDSDRTV